MHACVTCGSEMRCLVLGDSIGREVASVAVTTAVDAVPGRWRPHSSLPVLLPSEALHPGGRGRRVGAEVHAPHRQQSDAHGQVPDGHLCGAAHRDPGVAGRVLQVSEVHR